MAYAVTELVGIGPGYARRLAAANILTAEQLLALAATPDGRRSLSTTTGVREDLLLDWAHQADLLRLDGVAAGYVELLVRVGVSSVVGLSSYSAPALKSLLAGANEQKRRVPALPSEGAVAAWIAQAARGATVQETSP